MYARRKNASMTFAEEDDTDDGEDFESSRLARKKPRPSDDRGEGSSRSTANGSPATPSTPNALGNHSFLRTAAGSIDFCALCAKRFTVTTYTRHTPAGGLCHRCGPLHANGTKVGGNSPARASSTAGTSNDAAPKRAKARRKANQSEFDRARVPSLQSMCINIIANHIEDVEALFGIGGQNMDAISKSISKNRRLNSQTVMLFLQPSAKKLAFYDCSQLDSDALASIGRFCPYLEEINLQYCGMLDNAAIDAWAAKLPELRKVELYGPFLVRVDAWHRFFEVLRDRLTSFKIRESPRFDKGCCEKLVACCPNVTELGLAQIGPLNADCLAVLQAYGQQLTYLDVSDPGVSAPGVPPKSLGDDAIVQMLQHVGPRLTHLDISRNADLTSRTLLDGILANCASLQTLNMVLLQAEEIEPAHFVKLFEGLKSRGCAKLTKLSLERCLAVNDEVIAALIDFCGPNLVELNVNSCDRITEEGFKAIAKGCPNLQVINIGFCRQVTDGVVMELMNSMRQLREISLFACNKVSPFVSSSRVRIIGKEKYARA